MNYKKGTNTAEYQGNKMIRFTYDNEGDQEQDNKTARRRKRRHALVEGVILSIVVFSLSATVGVEFQNRANEMFMEIDRSHKGKLKSKEEKRKQKEDEVYELSEKVQKFSQEKNDK